MPAGVFSARSVRNSVGVKSVDVDLGCDLCVRFLTFLFCSNIKKETEMPKYVIEREIPNAGKLSSTDLQAISQKSCSVLRNLGPQIQWVESYVTDDKVYCVYIAPNERMIRDHAEQGGFPANRISEIKTVIDPTTAEKT